MPLAKEVRYLESLQAVADVTSLLRGVRDGRWYLYEPAANKFWTIVLFEKVRLYFRAEGNRFFVSDLGEALRSRALSTGDVECRSLADFSDSLRPPMLEGVLERDGRLYACTIGDSTCMEIEASDLPAAIVHIALVSYKLANLVERK